MRARSRAAAAVSGGLAHGRTRRSSRTHDFASAEQAGSFAHDPALREAMGQAGVEGAPRIEIFTDV